MRYLLPLAAGLVFTLYCATLSAGIGAVVLSLFDSILTRF